MRNPKTRWLGWGLLLAASVVLTVNAFWPAKKSSEVISLPQTVLTIEGAPIIVPESRIVIKTSPTVWFGTPSGISMFIDPVRNGEDAVDSMVNMVLIARLELPGILVRPTSEIVEPWTLNIPAYFEWNVTPLNDGLHEGLLWLSVEGVDADTAQSVRETVLAKQVRITSRSFWGIPVFWMRLGGVVGILIGLVFGIPAMLFSRK